MTRRSTLTHTPFAALLNPFKRCGCGRGYSAVEWKKLPYVGIQGDGEGGRCEMRNCPCGSTIAIELPPLSGPPIVTWDEFINRRRA